MLNLWFNLLAGEASAAFTHAMQHMGVFDCRLCVLPNESLVADYFAWRAEDAHRNSLNAYCYWKLREAGKTVTEATQQLKKLSVAAKNELLFGLGINYNNLPVWQKRGIGFYWTIETRKGFNPLSQQETEVQRKTLTCNMELPLTGYKEMISGLFWDQIT